MNHQTIQDFLASKSLSINSQKAYTYDLQQFLERVSLPLTEEKLALYQQSLATATAAVRKRKLSAVNQFLAHGYEQGALPHFYRLRDDSPLPKPSPKPILLDLSGLYAPSAHALGQLAALLILTFGLTPSQLLGIRVSQVDREFQILTLTWEGQMRVLELPDKLMPYLLPFLGQEERLYLFGKGDQAHSRQWLYEQMRLFLQTTGQPHLSAQSLRDQYLLQAVADGVPIHDLAKKIGLKTTRTLERYYQ